jgi:cytochrome c
MRVAAALVSRTKGHAAWMGVLRLELASPVVTCRIGAGVTFKFKDRRMQKIVLTAIAVIASAEPALAQDLAAGENSFKKCLPCHSVGADAKNKVGPVLNGLEGRKSGSVDGYNYTDANKNSGITWDEATFKEYITSPRAKIPGTKMVFAGISNENERTSLWAYLKQFDASGKKQ